MQPDTAIIVINHNGRQHLLECFNSLLTQTFAPLSLYLLDNASTDGSKEFVREHFPQVNILAMDKGYGFAGGYNRGVALVKEEFIGLISNDTRTDPGWTAAMRRIMDAAPDIAVAGSKIMLYDQPQRINTAGQEITPVGIGYDVGLGETDAPRFNKVRHSAAVCGAAIMVRKSLFEKIGGFDDDYFLLCEDTDLCWRTWMAGYRVVYQPQAVVLHKFGATIGRRETPLRVRQVQRNSIASVIKNRQDMYLGPALCGCLGYGLARMGFFLLTRQPALLKAQLDGLAGLIALLPSLLRKRKQLQAQRKLPDRQLLYKGVLCSWGRTVSEYVRLQKIRLTG